MKADNKLLIVLWIMLILNPNEIFAQQWNSIGPPGGRVTALSVNPTEPAIVFAGTEDQILFISMDGGKTSQAVQDSTGFYYFGSSKIYFNPNNQDTVYANSQRSINGGRSWQKMSVSVSSMNINPKNSKRIFASQFNKKELYVSNNAGETWDPIYVFNNSLNYIAQSPSDTNTLVAAAGDSIFKSSNSGNSWTYANLKASKIKKIGLNQTDQNELFVLAENIYKTTNGGQIWQTILSPTALSPINDFVLDPLNKNNIYAVTGDYLYGYVGHVYKSSNGGTSWQTINSGLPNELNRYLYQISINPLNPEEVYVGTYGFGVYKTINGGVEWGRTNITKPNVLNISFDTFKKNTIYASTFDQGILKSTDAGDTWIPLNLTTLSSIQSFYRQIVNHPINPNILYVAGVSRGLLKSTDGGTTWQSTNLTGDSDSFIWSIAIHPLTPETLFVGKMGFGSRDLYRSTDGGNSWNNLKIANNVGGIENILIDKRFPSIVNVCVGEHGFFKSTNSGFSWQKLNNGLIATDSPFVAPVMTVTVGLTSDELYLAQSAVGTINGGVRKSTDGGQSWFAIDSVLKIMDKRVSVQDISILSEHVIVSLKQHGQLNTQSYSPGGVFGLILDGNSAKKLFKGSSEVVKVDPFSLSRKYIGTKAGIYVTTDTISLIVKKISNQYPNEISLYQNYPNPFNSQTIIKYYLNKSIEAKIVIYDILGRIIKVFPLLNHFGENSIIWDGKNQENHTLSSGLYLYQIQTYNQSITKKLILLK